MAPPSSFFPFFRDDSTFPPPDDDLLKRVHWALRDYYDVVASIGPNGGYRDDGYINQLIAQNDLPLETIPRRYASGDDGIRVQSVEEIQRNIHRLINPYQGFQNPTTLGAFPGLREMRTLPRLNPSPQVQQFLQGDASSWNTPQLTNGMGLTYLNQNSPFSPIDLQDYLPPPSPQPTIVIKDADVFNSDEYKARMEKKNKVNDRRLKQGSQKPRQSPEEFWTPEKVQLLREAATIPQSLNNKTSKKKTTTETDNKQPVKYKAPYHSKAYLNQRQKFLNKLFGGNVFSSREMENPYAIINGAVTDNKNVAQMAAVADWILFQESTDGQWSDAKLRNVEEDFNKSKFSPMRRKLILARELNDILKENENAGNKRDDALAFARGLQVLIDASTYNGTVNEKQLAEDLKFFMIDQSYDLVGIPAKVAHDFKASNAAFNLFGGPRIGTIRWNKKYWDTGKQYDKNGKLINQVHHFMGLFIVGLDNPDLAYKEAFILDPPTMNDQDLMLAILAINMAQDVKGGIIKWKNLPTMVYVKLHD